MVKSWKEFLTVHIREENHNSKMTPSLQQTMSYMSEHIKPDVSFDIVYRVIEVGGRQACIYFIDGFCKDDVILLLCFSSLICTVKNSFQDFTIAFHSMS